MDQSLIVESLAVSLATKQASTLFINGTPGAGKTFLLQYLNDAIPREFPLAKVLGPFNVQSANQLSDYILNELHQMMYLESFPDEDTALDLNSSLYWLNQNLRSDKPLTFIILIDLATSWTDYDLLRVCFSSLRNLEAIWTARNIKIAALTTGFWDHPGLQDHYSDLALSFPYTVGANYYLWEEISLNETEVLIGRIPIDEALKPILAKQIHEVAGGNPTVIQDILTQFDTSRLSLEVLLNAIKQAAVDGQAARRLLELLLTFPKSTISVIEGLLFYRVQSVKSLSAELERLRLAGIVKEMVYLNQRFVTLRSWYIELFLRMNSNKLGLNLSHTEVEDLMPSVSVLNQEGYLVIQEIEYLLRNYIVNLLSKKRELGKPLFHGLVEKYDENGSSDAQTRADDWRKRSEERGLPSHLNPDIAYLSLTDLSSIVSELGASSNGSEWRQITKAIRDIISIRDAVMHNQLIEFSDLGKILILKKKLLTKMKSSSDL